MGVTTPTTTRFQIDEQAKKAQPARPETPKAAPQSSIVDWVTGLFTPTVHVSTEHDKAAEKE
eukprot:1688578-Prymnesium_polylepis.1